MSIREVSFYSYRSIKRQKLWSDAELGVLRFVRAIKGKPPSEIGASAPLRVKDKIHQIGGGNPEDAFEWFGLMAVDALTEHLKTTKVVLVPIPNSACASNDEASRTSKLAEAVAVNCDAAVHDILRWKKPMDAANRGGDRRPQDLYPHLRVRSGSRILSRPYVLIDDVASSGGHIRACAAALTAWGAVHVPLAIAGAQTAMEPVDDPYASTLREHPVYVP